MYSTIKKSQKQCIALWYKKNSYLEKNLRSILKMSIQSYKYKKECSVRCAPCYTISWSYFIYFLHLATTCNAWFKIEKGKLYLLLKKNESFAHFVGKVGLQFPFREKLAIIVYPGACRISITVMVCFSFMVSFPSYIPVNSIFCGAKTKIRTNNLFRRRTIVLASWPAHRLTLMTSSSSVYFFTSMSYLLLLWNIAPLKKRGPYLLIALWRSSQYKAYKKQEVTISILETTYLYLGSQTPFIAYLL